jgi:hypothetical protein
MYNHHFLANHTCGLDYKHIMIVNDVSTIISK